MKYKSLPITAILLSSVFLSGCMAKGEQFAGNVYKSDQVNQTQDAKTVKILAILPAKVEVDNTEGKQNAQIIGGLLGAIGGGVAGDQLSKNKTNGLIVGGVGGGAAAGSLVSDKVLVDGVSITYTRDHKTLHAVQVGRSCEFAPGTAIVIATNKKESRIQPNAACPEEK